MMFVVGRCCSQASVFCIRYTFTFDNNMPVTQTPVYVKVFDHDKKPSMVDSEGYRERLDLSMVDTLLFHQQP